MRTVMHVMRVLMEKHRIQYQSALKIAPISVWTP